MAVDHPLKQAAIDASITGGAVTMPLWVQSMEGWIQFALYIGGAVLLAFRLWLALREHRRLSLRDIVDSADGNG
jgi:hypothetical protein